MSESITEFPINAKISFSELLTLSTDFCAQIDALLNLDIIHKSDIKMVRFGTPLSERLFCQRITTLGCPVWQPSKEKIFQYYSRGWTIHVGSIDRFFPCIEANCKKLENLLSTNESVAVYCNYYNTPPKSYALAPHSDPYDVLVYHLRGSKEWKLYSSNTKPRSRYYYYQNIHNPITPKEAVVQVHLLKPGNTLVLPIGTKHQAFTKLKSASHLTYGIHRLCISDVINRALRKTLLLNLRDLPMYDTSFDSSIFLDVMENIITQAKLLKQDFSPLRRDEVYASLFRDITSLENYSEGMVSTAKFRKICAMLSRAMAEFHMEEGHKHAGNGLSFNDSYFCRLLSLMKSDCATF